MKSKKLISFFLAFLILLGTSSLFTRSSAADDKTILHMVCEFKDDKLKAVTWDGKQYVGVGGSFHTGYFVYTSPDGLNWEKQKLTEGTISLDKVVSNGKITAIAGDLSMDGLNAGMSKNGKDWQFRGEQDVRALFTKLVYFKNRFMTFDGNEIYVSPDGINYTSKIINVTDPRKLTPKGYMYLGGNSAGIYAASLATDGKYLYAATGDYFGEFVLRSTDGLNWEVTYFNKNKYLLTDESQCIIENGRYLIVCNENRLFVSENGKDWNTQDFARSDMNRVEKDDSSGRIVSEPPRVYGYKGVYYTQCYYTKNKIDISKDYVNFYEYNVDRAISDILFIDDRYIITGEGVIEYKAIKDGIASVFKNTQKSPNKKSLLTQTSSDSPSALKASGVTLNVIKEFRNPYWISSAVWDGTRYVGIGGNYLYISKDGKTWIIEKLGINGLSRIVFNDGIYTAVGKAKIAVSKNAKDWTLILGDNDNDKYFSDSNAVWFKGKLLYYDESEKMQVSDDGLKFRNETLKVTDPQKLIPAMNRSWGCLLYSIVSDGSHLYALYNWDKEKLILRSDDGISWEAVYKFENMDLNNDKIYINNGRIVVLGGDYMIVSTDGTNWTMEPTPIKNLYGKMSDGSRLPVFLSTYKGYWIIQQNIQTGGNSSTTESRFYISKDLKSFIEYKIEEGAGDFIYIDSNIMLTRIKAFDSKQVREFASAASPGN